MPQVVDHQRSEEWLQARQGKITASLAAACLVPGLHRYKTARAAWREIMGQKTEAEARPSEPGTPPHFGVIFEAPARLAYEAHTGAWVEETGFWVSDQYPWLGASPDGLIGAEGMCEIKCPELCSHKVEPFYRVQCLVQMIVTGRVWCDFAQFGWRNQELWVERVYPLSARGTEAIIRRLQAWHQQYVIGGEEPPKKTRRKKVTPF